METFIWKGNAVKEEVGEGLRILRLCFFAHDGFAEEAEALMREKGVFWSVREELDGLLRHVGLWQLLDIISA